MRRGLVFYVVTISVFGSLLWAVFSYGSRLEIQPGAETPIGLATEAAVHEATNLSPSSLFAAILSGLLQNLGQPLSLLLLQVAIIVLFSKSLAALFGKLRQPRVIGEIVAGIVLGPSVLGMVSPQLSNFIFRPDSLSNLHFLSQLGLILFMFIIGLELDVQLLRRKAQTALIVSHASIIFPFFLGVLLAYFLYEVLAPPQISFLAFGLFMGIAMSITAFPVLARILHERGLIKSPLGALAITCAAADDVTAWCILAAVVAIVQAGTALNAAVTVVLTVFFVLVMFKLVRPWLEGVETRMATGDSFHPGLAVLAIVVLLLSALTTEVIGIHALFGAFVAGISMPSRTGFRRSLVTRLEDISVVVLLPLFFAFTGLKTQIGLLRDTASWVACGLIILVAVAGKFGGSMLAAKYTGQSWLDALAIGALMNTRGLMELVVLTIGYDLGVLSATVFTMMVLMALVTTMMTRPALSFIDHLRKPPALIQSLPERT